MVDPFASIHIAPIDTLGSVFFQSPRGSLSAIKLVVKNHYPFLLGKCECKGGSASYLVSSRSHNVCHCGLLMSIPKFVPRTTVSGDQEASTAEGILWMLLRIVSLASIFLSHHGGELVRWDW